MYNKYNFINKEKLRYFELQDLVSKDSNYLDELIAMIPNKLYKYRDFKHLEIFDQLLNGKAWFSSPLSWKDSCDSHFSFDLDWENINENNKDSSVYLEFKSFCEKVKNHEEIKFEFPIPTLNRIFAEEEIQNGTYILELALEYSKQLCLNFKNKYELLSSPFFYDLLTIMTTMSVRNVLNTTIEEPEQIRQRSIVYCLTEDFNNDKQWEDYANNGDGFCIEYSFEHKKDIFSKLGYNIFPILYGEKPKIKASDLYKACDLNFNNSMRCQKMHTENKIISLFSKKLEYLSEKEWRIVLNKQSDNNLIDFNYVTGIYIGNNVNEENESKLLNVAKKINAKVYKRKFDKLTGDWYYQEVA